MRLLPVRSEIVACAEADAPVEGVWALAADLRRASEWNPLVERVEGAVASAVGGERVHVTPAGRLGRLPTPARRVAVDVALVDPPAELGLVAYPLPGLTVRVRLRLGALTADRTACELRVRLAGVLALAHRAVARAVAGSVVRALARAAAVDSADGAAGVTGAGGSRAGPPDEPEA